MLNIFKSKKKFKKTLTFHKTRWDQNPKVHADVDSNEDYNRSSLSGWSPCTNSLCIYVTVESTGALLKKRCASKRKVTRLGLQNVSDKGLKIGLRRSQQRGHLFGRGYSRRYSLLHPERRHQGEETGCKIKRRGSGPLDRGDGGPEENSQWLQEIFQCEGVLCGGERERWVEVTSHLISHNSLRHVKKSCWTVVRWNCNLAESACFAFMYFHAQNYTEMQEVGNLDAGSLPAGSKDRYLD